MSFPEILDLRSITRISTDVQTVIELPNPKMWPRWKQWIILGAAALTKQGDGHVLKAYMNNGATDFEHDAAYALRIEIIGLEFDEALFGHVSFEGWINPLSRDFNVPAPGYDPTKLEGAKQCTRCTGDDAHIIVPEGFWYPPIDKELQKRITLSRVRISIGPPRKEEE